MIPMPPWLLGLATEKVAKVLIGLAFALCFFLIGMGAHKVFADRKIARMERDYAQQQATLNAELAKAEQHARETEARWRADSVRMETAYFAALTQRDGIVRQLHAAGTGLRNKLAAIEQQAAAGASSTCGDVHHRVEALAVLLGEADSLAEESGRAADDLRDELALCRTYARSVSKQD
jgi:hypothetical protein